jgi:3-deoxy-D-arabino-heptulosonate 7-phosphate (DAHP) synthase
MANDLRVHSVSALLPPSCVVEEQPADADIYAHVLGFRESLLDIVVGASPKFLVILAPRGTPDELLQAAQSPQAGALGASAEVQLIMQPILPLNARRNQAVAQHRHLLLQLAAMGLPAAAAFDDTITPQCCADLLTHASVPAEAAMMRELVSGERTLTRRLS